MLRETIQLFRGTVKQQLTWLLEAGEITLRNDSESTDMLIPSCEMHAPSSAALIATSFKLDVLVSLSTGITCLFKFPSLPQQGVRRESSSRSIRVVVP